MFPNSCEDSCDICIKCFVVSVLGETLVNVLDCKKDMGLWHGVLTVGCPLICPEYCIYLFCFNICTKHKQLCCFFPQSVMNRIHTITVPYAVMKACPMSWVQRVHIHKGAASVKLLDVS